MLVILPREVEGQGYVMLGIRIASLEGYEKLKKNMVTHGARACGAN